MWEGHEFNVSLSVCVSACQTFQNTEKLSIISCSHGKTGKRYPEERRLFCLWLILLGRVVHGLICIFPLEPINWTSLEHKSSESDRLQPLNEEKKKKQAFYMMLMPYFLKIVKHRETQAFIYKSNDVFFQAFQIE